MAFDALVAGTAFVVRSDRGVVRLTGADRLPWLQGLVTNDVAGLRPGQRVYAAYLTAQGRMITDLWVVETPDATLLDVPGSLAAHLAGRLDSLVFAEDVQVVDASHEWTVLQVFGVAPPMGSALVHPDSTFGVPASAVYAQAADLPALRAEMAATHAEAGIDDLEVLRIEAGVPRFLVDMTDDTIPLEAGIEDRAISFTKGCYVGQEIIVRVTTRGGGRVARRLVGLRIEGEVAVHAGASLHGGDRTVGRLTSVTWSPRRAGVIGLGYVHRDFIDAGTPLEVLHDDQRVRATVHALPFVAARS